jgi:hypothetical protein
MFRTITLLATKLKWQSVVKSLDYYYVMGGTLKGKAVRMSF